MMVLLFWLTLGLDVLSEFGRVQDLSEKSEESHEAVGPRGSIKPPWLVAGQGVFLFV